MNDVVALTVRVLPISEEYIATLQGAREKGLERVELEVFASNRPAIRLYESLGFVVEGIKRRGRKLDGAYDDVLEMTLFL